MQTWREVLSRTSALTTCTFLRPATAALRWVDPAGFRTTAKTVAFGRPACEQENEYWAAESRGKRLHQLQNIFEADSSRSTNDSVGRHCSRISGCKMGFCEFDPPAFMAPRCGLRFAAPGSQRPCSRTEVYVCRRHPSALSTKLNRSGIAVRDSAACY